MTDIKEKVHSIDKRVSVVETNYTHILDGQEKGFNEVKSLIQRGNDDNKGDHEKIKKDNEKLMGMVINLDKRVGLTEEKTKNNTEEIRYNDKKTQKKISEVQGQVELANDKLEKLENLKNWLLGAAAGVGGVGGGFVYTVIKVFS